MYQSEILPANILYKSFEKLPCSLHIVIPATARSHRFQQLSGFRVGPAPCHDTGPVMTEGGVFQRSHAWHHKSTPCSHSPM